MQFPYSLLCRTELIRQMNFLGSSNIPFFFLVDFEGRHGYMIECSDLNKDYIRFELSTGHCPKAVTPQSFFGYQMGNCSG